jgi:hypothetical protein
MVSLLGLAVAAAAAGAAVVGIGAVIGEMVARFDHEVRQRATDDLRDWPMKPEASTQPPNAETPQSNPRGQRM